MDFIQSIDWMQLLRCFIVAGLICIIGQILIDKTKLTPARILVIFVTTGAVLGGIGVYQKLIDFAGWCNSSINRFWCKFSKRCIRGSFIKRSTWSIYWRSKSICWRYSCCCILWIFSFTYSKTKNKKTIA